MSEPQSRRLLDLIGSDKSKLAPVQATDQELEELARGPEELTVLSVETKDNPDFGAIHELTVQRQDGTVLLVGLWANPQRDQTISTLMQLCQDGPVSGVAIENRGTDRKPFYVPIAL